MCTPHDLYGFKRRTPGAMASYMVFPPEAIVHRISSDVPAHHAAFAEPLSCSLHAVERAGISFGDVVVVAGCGPIGLGMVLGAVAKSPAHAAAVAQGLRLLRKLGTYVEYGVFGSEVTVDWSIISDDKELDVRGAHLGPYCWPAAIRMLESGALPMDRICSHQLPLARFQEGLDLVSDGSRSMKVSLIPE